MYVTFASPTLLQQSTPVGGGPIRTLLQPTQRICSLLFSHPVFTALIMRVTCDFTIYAHFLKAVSIYYTLYSFQCQYLLFSILNFGYGVT